MTIVRFRGGVTSWLQSFTASGDGFRMAFGIRIVTPEAFAAGIASMPTPIADIGDNGWVYHRMWDLIGQGATLESPGVFDRFQVDSKAMRKIQAGYVVVGIMEGEEIGTAVVEWEGNTRLLSKLS